MPFTEAMLDDALGVLLSDELRPVVDVVLARRGPTGEIVALTPDGSCGLDAGGVRWVRGRNPLERGDPGAFSPLEVERAAVRPANNQNHYPYACENIAQLFANPAAPDIAVVHTPAHNWEERGGHRGEHGSLDLVQSRAPLVLAGAGVRAAGRLDAHARMIDVAPTLAALAGVPEAGGSRLRAQDGRALSEALDGTAADCVVAFLMDGTNANVLWSLAQAGELPAIARVMEAGTVFGHGLLASFPSVTLANHTTAITGVHPGRHGIIHNAWFDRRAGTQILANSPATWHLARERIAADVETVFEAVARAGLGFTAAVNEPADRGASSATFDVVRAGAVPDLAGALPRPADVPHATAAFVDKRDYAWATAADHMAVVQARGLLAGDAGNPRPRLLWVNLTLPDAASHAGGPYSEIAAAGLRDTDRRVGEVLEAAGWEDGRTAVVLLADHGMEESDPACRGDFDEALRAAGIPFRDEAYGFLYLGE